MTSSSVLRLCVFFRSNHPNRLSHSSFLLTPTGQHNARVSRHTSNLLASLHFTSRVRLALLTSPHAMWMEANFAGLSRHKIDVCPSTERKRRGWIVSCRDFGVIEHAGRFRRRLRPKHQDCNLNKMSSTLNKRCHNEYVASDLYIYIKNCHALRHSVSQRMGIFLVMDSFDPVTTPIQAAG